MDEGTAHEQIIESYCMNCWLYEQKNENNAQEVIECEKCRNALTDGTPIERILGRYSKNREGRGGGIPSVWDQVFRPPRKFGEHGIRRIDYAIYAKLRGKFNT